jgi:hypothetical protein
LSDLIGTIEQFLAVNYHTFTGHRCKIAVELYAGNHVQHRTVRFSSIALREFFTWGVDLLDLPAPSDGPTHSGRGCAPRQGSVISEQSVSRREEN